MIRSKINRDCVKIFWGFVYSELLFSPKIKNSRNCSRGFQTKVFKLLGYFLLRKWCAAVSSVRGWVRSTLLLQIKSCHAAVASELLSPARRPRRPAMLRFSCPERPIMTSKTSKFQHQRIDGFIIDCIKQNQFHM